MEKIKLVPALQKVIRESGSFETNAIQAQAVPVLLAGRNALLEAALGAGKTTGCVWALLHKLAMSRSAASKFEGETGIRLLILVTQVDKAETIYAAFKQWGKNLQISCQTALLEKNENEAGVAIDLACRKRNTDVLISTPKDVAQMIEEGALDLGQVQYLWVAFDSVANNNAFAKSAALLAQTLPATHQLILTAENSAQGDAALQVFGDKLIERLTQAEQILEKIQANLQDEVKVAAQVRVNEEMPPLCIEIGVQNTVISGISVTVGAEYLASQIESNGKIKDDKYASGEKRRGIRSHLNRSRLQREDRRAAKQEAAPLDAALPLERVERENDEQPPKHFKEASDFKVKNNASRSSLQGGSRSDDRNAGRSSHAGGGAALKGRGAQQSRKNQSANNAVSPSANQSIAHTEGGNKPLNEKKETENLGGKDESQTTNKPSHSKLRTTFGRRNNKQTERPTRSDDGSQKKESKQDDRQNAHPRRENNAGAEWQPPHRAHEKMAGGSYEKNYDKRQRTDQTNRQPDPTLTSVDVMSSRSSRRTSFSSGANAGNGLLPSSYYKTVHAGSTPPSGMGGRSGKGAYSRGDYNSARKSADK